MATFSSSAPRLAGITVAHPCELEENSALAAEFGHPQMQGIIESTGIERRPIAKSGTISDLASIAGKSLLESLNWDTHSIDAIIVVTQTPDYPLPATACLLQHRLNFKTNTLALDINLGCSGYIYGLSVINGLMQTGGLKRALLVCGDLTSRMIAPGDRALRPLFGDAVAVTALEYDAGPTLHIDLGTDGSGAPYLISKTGGMHEPGTPQLFMDGVQVMAFSLKRVAPSIQEVLKQGAMKIQDMDAVVFHQANAMMLRSLARKIGAHDSQLVVALKNFGNTSSASIPVALCHWMQGRPVSASEKNLLLSGFGVGWSWATALWKTSQPQVADFISVPPTR